jgi:hypothetical protein
VAQLLAIRWLGAHKAEGEKARALLEQIAGGKKAQDPIGFARDHARRALARFDGKASPAGHADPGARLRAEAWGWFPDDVSVLGGVDLRALGELPAPDEDRIRSLIRKGFPREAREALYKAADQTGNVRLERVALAFAGARSEIVYLRFTGAWDPKRLAGYLSQKIPGGKLTVKKGGKAAPVTLVSGKQGEPAFALVGGTELLVAAYLEEGNASPVPLVERALGARAGGRKSAAAGRFAEPLKKIAGRPYALLLAELPETTRQEMKGARQTFQAVPRRVEVRATCDKNFNLHLQCAFKDGAEAGAFVGGVKKLKRQGLDALKAPPRPGKLAPRLTGILTRALDSLQVSAKGGTVTGSCQVPGEALPALLDQMLEDLKR